MAMALMPTALATLRMVTASWPPFSSRRKPATTILARVSFSCCIFTLYGYLCTLYRNRQELHRTTETRNPACCSRLKRRRGGDDSPYPKGIKIRWGPARKPHYPLPPRFTKGACRASPSFPHKLVPFCGIGAAVARSTASGDQSRAQGHSQGPGGRRQRQGLA